MTEVKRLAADESARIAGCWFDGHRGQYIYGEVVQLACEYGYKPTDGWLAHNEAETGQVTEWTVEEADRAESWLNEHVASDGYSFGWHDGEWFYWPDTYWQEDDSPDHESYNRLAY